MRLLFVFCLFLILSHGHGAAIPDSVRSNYVSRFERDFNFGPFINYRLPTISMKSGEGDRVAFRTNNNYIAGLRMHVFGLQVQVATALEPGTNSLSRYGKTSASEFMFNYMSHKWFGNINLFRYQGLWFKHSGEDYKNKPFPSRSDVVLTNRSASVTHLFNPKRFSMRAPYGFTEHQLNSGGSFLVQLNINEISFTGESELIENEFATRYPDLEKIKGISFTGIGIAPGYSYNYVYKDFFLNGTFTAGPSHYWIQHKAIDSPATYDIQFNFVTDLWLAAGYNGERFFAGLTWRSNGFQLKKDGTRILGNQNSFSLTAGFRLHEEGVFKKRIYDLLPHRLKTN